MKVLAVDTGIMDVRLTRAELGMLAAALNELCNGGHMDDPEFQTRLGFDRTVLDALGDEIYAVIHRKP